MTASSNAFRTTTMVAAAILAASLLLLAVSANKARAIFPGSNNAIAFVTDRDGSFQIYRMGSDGFGQSSLTDPRGKAVIPPSLRTARR